MGHGVHHQVVEGDAPLLHALPHHLDESWACRGGAGARDLTLIRLDLVDKSIGEVYGEVVPVLDLLGTFVVLFDLGFKIRRCPGFQALFETRPKPGEKSVEEFHSAGVWYVRRVHEAAGVGFLLLRVGVRPLLRVHHQRVEVHHGGVSRTHVGVVA